MSQTKSAKWTVMIYLAGDNNLSAAGEADLQEMRTVGSTAETQVVVQFDCAGDRGTQRFLLQRGGTGERLQDLGETDAGSPDVLLDFVRWAAGTYPAERYALILWNHGGGWEPSEVDRVAREVGADNYSAREAGERAASPLGKVLFRTTLERILRLPSPADRAICSDDGSGHSLDTVELGRVLGQVQGLLGQPLDLLGMDACLMSNLEVAYQARPYARYLVASEENEPNQGWPWDRVLGALVREPAMPTADLARTIVGTYVASYADRGYPEAVTQSAFDLSRVAALAEPLDRLAEVLLARMAESATELWSAQRQSARFWHNTLWDIGHFCEALGGLTADAGVRRATEEVRAALQVGPGNFVIAERHNGRKVERCTGVTIYLLPPLSEISRYYAELDFAREHRWPALLEAYHAT